jgi:hypothetical protein
MTALYKALRRWRVEGNLGGLRRLTVPSQNSDDLFRASKEFIDNAVTNCPQVELLDGYKGSDCLTCDEAWPLTLLHLEKFNKTCTRLREFNWGLGPFGDPYFRVFGEYTKPQLKKLTFGVSIIGLGTGTSMTKARLLGTSPTLIGSSESTASALATAILPLM